VIGRDPQPGHRIGKVIEDPKEERNVEHRKLKFPKCVQIALRKLNVSRQMPGEKLRLIDPVLTHVESEATAGAVTSRLEEVPAGITRAVENGASLEPVRQHVAYEMLYGRPRPEEAMPYAEEIFFRYLEVTGTDARRDLDNLLPWCEATNFSTDFFGVHAGRLWFPRSELQSETGAAIPSTLPPDAALPPRCGAAGDKA
jgi:hypothetical protein